MPKINLEDTIAALSTPPGEGGMAVIRVSGKEAVFLCQKFFESSSPQNGKLSRAPTHTIHHGRFVDEKGEMIDEVLMNLFRSPHSYTGEEVVEINCHGGMRVTKRIFEILTRNGARHAEPGEFTKRAFLHGKMDLTQAEAVLDLIRSRSDRGLETALQQLQGSLSKKIILLKDSLMKIYAHFEASLDFPDEHLEMDSKEKFLKRIEEIDGEISSLIASFRRGQAMREGILTVIVGRPNVGKSSLLNALLQKDRALVSEIPGTTRDSLEEMIEIGGMAVRLVDTAGLAASGDPLDRLGMERTRRYLDEGSLFLFLVDGSSPWTPEDQTISDELEEKNYLFVVNKTDLPQKLDRANQNPCLISCLKQKGIEELVKRIGEKIETVNFHESATLTRLRHKQAFEKSLESLREAKQALEEDLSAEFILEDLKKSVESLQELVGEIYSEDFLDVIFQEFCIGK